MARVSVRNCCGADENGFDFFSPWSYADQKESILLIVWALCRVGRSSQLPLSPGEAPGVKPEGILLFLTDKTALRNIHETTTDTNYKKDTTLSSSEELGGK